LRRAFEGFVVAPQKHQFTAGFGQFDRAGAANSSAGSGDKSDASI
jgi:hypothetical protein